jgi:hypothetical protein
MDEIKAGCEGAVTAMKRWMQASMTQDIAVLEEVLAPEYQFTSSPDIIPDCRMNKAAFIAMIRNFHNSDIRLLKIVAERMEGIVMTMMFVEVHEEVSGDFGAGMPDAAAMSEMVNGHSFAYASAWREEAGKWLCTSHNVLAKVC